MIGLIASDHSMLAKGENLGWELVTSMKAERSAFVGSSGSCCRHQLATTTNHHDRVEILLQRN